MGPGGGGLTVCENATEKSRMTMEMVDRISWVQKLIQPSRLQLAAARRRLALAVSPRSPPCAVHDYEVTSPAEERAAAAAVVNGMPGGWVMRAGGPPLTETTQGRI